MGIAASMAVCSGLLYHGRIGPLDPSLIPLGSFHASCHLQHPRPVELRRRIRRWRRRSAPAACAPRLTSVLDVLRAGALDEVKQVAAGRAGGLSAHRGGIAAAGGGRRKNPLHRGELRQPRRRADRGRRQHRGQISQHVLQAAEHVCRAQPADPAAAGIRAARIRGRDRVGHRQDRPAHPEGPRAGPRRRHHHVQRGHHPRLDQARPLQRHPGQVPGIRPAASARG